MVEDELERQTLEKEINLGRQLLVKEVNGSVDSRFHKLWFRLYSVQFVSLV